MGVYYFYVNDSKKQFFCIDPIYAHIKSPFLGRNIGSRALSYLILHNDPCYTNVADHPLIGSWIGDSFFVTGDDYCPEFGAIRSEYTDIGEPVIEMLITVKPWDLIHHGGIDWFIRWATDDESPFKMTANVQDRMRECLEEENRKFPNDDIARMLDALDTSK